MKYTFCCFIRLKGNQKIYRSQIIPTKLSCKFDDFLSLVKVEIASFRSQRFWMAQIKLRVRFLEAVK